MSKEQLDQNMQGHYGLSGEEVQQRTTELMQLSVGQDNSPFAGVYCLINAILNIAGALKQAGFEDEAKSVGDYMIEVGTSIREWKHEEIISVKEDLE